MRSVRKFGNPSFDPVLAQLAETVHGSVLILAAPARRTSAEQLLIGGPVVVLFAPQAIAQLLLSAVLEALGALHRPGSFDGVVRQRGAEIQVLWAAVPPATDSHPWESDSAENRAPALLRFKPSSARSPARASRAPACSSGPRRDGICRRRAFASARDPVRQSGPGHSPKIFDVGGRRIRQDRCWPLTLSIHSPKPLPRTKKRSRRSRISSASSERQGCQDSPAASRNRRRPHRARSER